MNTIKFIMSLVFGIYLISSSPAHAKSIWTPFSDTVNSGIINVKIATDKSLKNTNIDATVVDGVAVFSGQVNSKEQLEEIMNIAHSVSGVKGVDTSKLEVKK